VLLSLAALASSGIQSATAQVLDLARRDRLRVVLAVTIQPLDSTDLTTTPVKASLLALPRLEEAPGAPYPLILQVRRLLELLGLRGIWSRHPGLPVMGDNSEQEVVWGLLKARVLTAQYQSYRAVELLESLRERVPGSAEIWSFLSGAYLDCRRLRERLVGSPQPP